MEYDVEAHQKAFRAMIGCWVVMLACWAGSWLMDWPTALVCMAGNAYFLLSLTFWWRLYPKRRTS